MTITMLGEDILRVNFTQSIISASLSSTNGKITGNVNSIDLGYIGSPTYFNAMGLTAADF